MIKLNALTAKQLYIPPENAIVTVDAQTGSTAVISNGQYYIVAESPEEVTRKILEYKLAMARYSMTYAISVGRGDKMSPTFETDETEWEIRALAGLEDKADE